MPFLYKKTARWTYLTQSQSYFISVPPITCPQASAIPNVKNKLFGELHPRCWFCVYTVHILNLFCLQNTLWVHMSFCLCSHSFCLLISRVVLALFFCLTYLFQDSAQTSPFLTLPVRCLYISSMLCFAYFSYYVTFFVIQFLSLTHEIVFFSRAGTIPVSQLITNVLSES